MYRRIIGIAGLVLMLMGCNEGPLEGEKEIQEIRSYYQKFEQFENLKEQVYDLYDSIQSNSDYIHLDKDLQYALDLSYLYNTYIGNDQICIEKLDSVINLPNFEQQHNLNQFYTYYFLAYKYAETLKPKMVFKYYFKADSCLLENPMVYVYERNKIRRLMSNTTTLILHMEDHQLKEFKNNFQQALAHPHRDVVVLSKYSYNIAYRLSLLNRYEESLQWVDTSLNLFEHPFMNHLYPDLIDMKFNCYYHLGKLDLALQEYEKILKVYKRGDITEKAFRRFQHYNVVTSINLRKNKDLIKDTDELLAFYTPICKNRYPLSMIYKARSIIFQNTRQYAKEREALVENLKYVSNCGKTDEYFITEEKRILSRLLKLDIAYENPENLHKWNLQLDSINYILNENRYAFVNLNQHFSKNEIQYVQGEMDHQQELEDAIRKENWMKAFIMILIILAFGFSYLIYKSNKKHQINIAEKNQLLNINYEKITKQNDELQYLIASLEESNENLQNFAKVAANDIQSPLVTIHNNISKLDEKKLSYISEEDQQIFCFLKESTSKLSHMINVLLDYSSTYKIIEIESIEIVPILENILRNLQEVIHQSKVQISYPASIPLVLANASLIEQVFQNLIANAIKFKQKGRPAKIDISYSMLSSNTICFHIQDNGIGIPKEHQKDIFRVFCQLHTKKNIEGSGIGLSTCYRIVESFGGKIWVESTVGKGSKFNFTLPCGMQKSALDIEKFIEEL